MSMLEMYGKLPTTDELIAALASPVVPKSATSETEAELSSEQMIKEIFTIVKGHNYNGIS